MTSTLKVNTITKKCGSTLTLGESGTTVAIASGASTSGMGRTGTVDWQTGSIKTGDFTAVNGEGYFADTTSGAITMTLPSSPSAGNIVSVKDYKYKFATNALTVNRNGSKIGGDSGTNPSYSTNGTALTFIYVDATQGWLVINESTDTTTAESSAYISASGGNTTATVCTNYKVHTFTSPGTFTVSAGSGPLAVVDYLVIGGGGGGGIGYAGGYCGGGGGAGGYRESKVTATSGCWSASPLAATSSLPLAPAAYPITVGAGGSGRTGCSGCGTGPNVAPGTSGSNSILSSITSAGGGGGGSNTASAPTAIALSGGSGGGGAFSTCGGSGNTPPVSPPQGQNGGNGHGPSANNSAGGGGGAGATGGNVPGPSVGGNGGAGVTSSINATPTQRAGGGGGSGNTTKGTGGAGGGGNGALNSPAVNGVAGTANTGGGGGGGTRYSTGVSAAGGSGVVIIRYRFQ
tara:strand:- start:54 stop:1433 length:1380 start_codon:yes stop_codon:yes gene_type:complete